MLARLGNETRFFPYPVWADRNREPVISEADLDKTLLVRLNDLLRVTPSRAVLADEVVTVSLPATIAPKIAAQWLTINTIGASVDFNRDECDAAITWVPGQAAPSPTTAGPTPVGEGGRVDLLAMGRVAGMQVVFLNNDNEGSGAQPHEDRFVVFMSDAQWADFAKAAGERVPFDVAGSKNRQSVRIERW